MADWTFTMVTPDHEAIAELRERARLGLLMAEDDTPELVAKLLAAYDFEKSRADKAVVENQEPSPSARAGRCVRHWTNGGLNPIDVCGCQDCLQDRKIANAPKGDRIIHEEVDDDLL